jgi:hypothetical protein
MPRRKFQERIAFRRLTARQITRVLRYHYGPTLPDDDAGRDDLALMLGYLSHMPHGTTKAENFIDLWAPWCALEERQLALRDATLSPSPRLTADQLAARLGVSMVLRNKLALTVIGAIDCDKESRSARRKARKLARDKERQQQRRRAKGAKLRAEYEARALSRTKPWVAEGISRRTWERRRNKLDASPQNKADASPSPSILGKIHSKQVVASPSPTLLKNTPCDTLATRRTDRQQAGENQGNCGKATPNKQRHHKQRVGR